MAEPEALVCDVNLAENWINFYESFTSSTIAEKRRLRNRDAQLESNDLVGTFVSFLGTDGRRLFRTLFKNSVDMDPESYYESLNTKDVCKRFNDHCKRQRNECAETHKFNRKKSVRRIVRKEEAKVEEVAAVEVSERKCFKCGKQWKPDHRCEESVCFRCNQPGHFKASPGH